MHDTSMKIMSEFLSKYGSKDKAILDVGSCQVKGHGTYRDIVKGVYVGIDIEPGLNVDCVVDPYDWGYDEDFDIIISGQVLEHVEYPWKWFEQAYKTLKKGGYMCVITPGKQPIHRYPVDTFRYNPDGYNALAKWSGLKLVAVNVYKNAHGDVAGVFVK